MTPAKMKDVGMDTRTPMTVAAAILRIVSADLPCFFKMSADSIMGEDRTPPGRLTSAVGIRFVRFNDTIDAMKKVNTNMGSIPASTKPNEMGNKTDVSSVPGIKPINVYIATAARAMPIICSNNSIVIIFFLDRYLSFWFK